MTFLKYSRARRMELARTQIRAGASMIDAQIATGYESGSGFRDAFSRILGAAPADFKQTSAKSARKRLHIEKELQGETT